jgi:hypothetical protein
VQIILQVFGAFASTVAVIDTEDLDVWPVGYDWELALGVDHV